MSLEVPQCKITVLKRTLNQDLIHEYIEEAYQDMGPCECFQEGQEFLIKDHDELSRVPEGFCASAWADIRKDIMTIHLGGNWPGLKKSGTAIVGCTDWFRPVLFKIERLD